jgi:hypothetical protein
MGLSVFSMVNIWNSAGSARPAGLLCAQALAGYPCQVALHSLFAGKATDSRLGMRHNLSSTPPQVASIDHLPSPCNSNA